MRLVAGDHADHAVGKARLEIEDRNVANIGSNRHDQRASRKLLAGTQAKFVQRLAIGANVFVRRRDVTGLNKWIGTVIKRRIVAGPVGELTTDQAALALDLLNFPMFRHFANPIKAGRFEFDFRIDTLRDRPLND